MTNTWNSCGCRRPSLALAAKAATSLFIDAKPYQSKTAWTLT